MLVSEERSLPQRYFEAETVVEEKHRAMVRRLVNEAWNLGYLEVADEIVDSDFVLHDPLFGDLCGVEGLKAWLEDTRTAFPDFRVTVHYTIAEGDKVAEHWEMRGTHEGEFAGILPTGRPGRITGLTVYRFAGYRLVEMWQHADNLTLLRQLGVVRPLAAQD